MSTDIHEPTDKTYCKVRAIARRYNVSEQAIRN